METLTWLITFALVGVWLVVGIELLRSPPALGLGWSKGIRRVLWGALWIAALMAGTWGPELWSQSSASYSEDSAVGAPTEQSLTVIRTPVAVRTTTVDRDSQGRRVQANEELTMQLPIALLLFLGLVLVVRLRENGRGRFASGGASAALLVMFAAGACDPPPRVESPDPGSRPDRQTTDAAWDTLIHLEIEAEDTLLYSADALAASPRGFWVLDRIGYRIAHFDWEGRLQWYAGGRGGGPGEFLNPRVIDLDGEDRIWALDLQNDRITGFDVHGQMVGEVSLQSLDARIHDFAVDPTGERFFGMYWEENLHPVAVDSRGRVSQGDPIEVPDARNTGGMALQGLVAGPRDAEGWVYAFSLGDGLFRLRDVRPAGPRVRYPEPVPFPRLIVETRESGNVTETSRRLSDPHFAADGLAVVGGRIYVQFRGETPEAGRLLDIYDLDTGEYVETRLLPRPGVFGAWEDRILLAWNDPAPRVLVLQATD